MGAYYPGLDAHILFGLDGTNGKTLLTYYLLLMAQIRDGKSSRT
jgi:UDP-N-acetylmuramyl tripeptide synthase